jgi:hypothetical protein
VLDAALPEGDLATAFAAFAARNAVWDYPTRDLFVPWIDAYADYYDRSPIAATIGPDGTDWVALERAPHPYGYAVIELARGADATRAMRVEVAADLATAELLAPTLHATLVRVTDGVATYEPLAVTAGAAAGDLALPPSEPVAYLALALTTERRGEGAVPTRLRVAPAQVPEPPPGPGPAPEPEPGGGCSAGGRASPGAAGLIVVVIAMTFGSRRRRRRA